MYMCVDHLKRLITDECGKERPAILDVGGGLQPFPSATHVLDPIDRGATGYGAVFIQHDAVLTPWPFADDTFDFAICSHTLEDLRDPLAVARELKRVARAGYIEVPHRLEELSKGVSDDPDLQGWLHHSWLFEAQPETGNLLAIPKTCLAARYIIEHPHPRYLGYFWSKASLGERSIVETDAELHLHDAWVRNYDRLARSEDHPERIYTFFGSLGALFFSESRLKSLYHTV